jgi:hypothetical protein
MLETTTRTIGEDTYRVTPLQAIQGRKVLVKLLKALGPAAEAVADAQSGNVGALLAKLTANLEESLVDELCEIFAGRTEFQHGSKWIGLGEAGQFDLHFIKKYGQMAKWLAFCVEINYGSFLGELLKSGPGTP